MSATKVLTSSPIAAPWFGRPHEHRHALVALAGSLMACAIYWYGTTHFAPDYVPGIIEFSGTATSLWCVWITQRRNVLALPIGIVSVVLMFSALYMLFLVMAFVGLVRWHRATTQSAA